MIEKTLEIILKGIKEDRSLDDMQKTDVLKDWKVWNGKYFKELDSDTWILMIYANIIKNYKLSASEKLAELIEKSGMENSKSELRKMMLNNSKYYFLEREFNLLGYQLMNSGKLKDAIEVFKLTVEMYPNSWNTYDSLGEAYMNNGDKELAIENYERSFKMNPNNTNATQQLEKLKKQ